MSSDEIPISTLIDARGRVELGLVAGEAFEETGISLFGSKAQSVADLVSQVRAQCLAIMRQQAHALGGNAIAGASIAISVTELNNVMFVVGAHGLGTAVKQQVETR